MVHKHVTVSVFDVENCHYYTETFDVLDVEVESRGEGNLCFDIKYVPGGIKGCFIRFNCTTGRQYLRNETINGTYKCIHGIPAHSGYVIVATDSDLDAIENIDVIAPFTTTVVVPSYTATASRRITQTGLSIIPSVWVLTSCCVLF